MDRMHAIWAGVVAGFAFGGVAIAEEQRFLVQGSRLFFNSSIPYAGGQEDEIVLRDAEEMGLYLMENADVDTVVLSSNGGLSHSAFLMAEKIDQLGLATEVRDRCFSACPMIFLAGEPRVLADGAIIGFHRPHIAAADTASFEADSAMVGVVAYDQGISSAIEDLRFMLRRGVSEDFALMVLGTPPAEDWIPSREELISGGVIDE